MNSNSNIDGWDHTILKNIAAINYGKSPKEILSSFGGYPVVGTGGTERYGNEFIYDGESIILGRKGTIDRIHFVSGRFWTIDTAYYLSDFNNALPIWLFYYLQNIDLRQLNEATGVPSLSRDLLYKIKVLKPPKPQQSKIAEVLSTVDRAIEQTEGLIAKQRRIKTGLMQGLLTRGIDEHGHLRSKETHEFKDSPLGRIPVEWEVSPAYTLCSAVVDCKNRTPPLRSDGYPVIRTPNVRDGRFIYDDLAFTNKKSFEIWTARGKPTVGDVIITREAPFGEACLIPKNIFNACLGQRMMMYQVDPSLLDDKYLVYAIYSERIQKRLFQLAGGSTVGHIRVGDIRNLPIAHPLNVEEQLKISNILSGVDILLEQSRKELIKYSALKKGLMQDLITGKVRVTPLLEDKYGC